jgi:plastocyanin
MPRRGVVRISRVLALCLAATLAFAGCGDDGDDEASDTTAPAAADGAAITIESFAFEPATLTVDAGTTVTVTNDDSAAHTWTADDGEFDVADLSPGDTGTHTFDDAGSFAYHCEIHPSMKGTVVVE